MSTSNQTQNRGWFWDGAVAAATPRLSHFVNVSMSNDQLPIHNSASKVFYSFIFVTTNPDTRCAMCCRCRIWKFTVLNIWSKSNGSSWFNLSRQHTHTSHGEAFLFSIRSRGYENEMLLRLNTVRSNSLIKHIFVLNARGIRKILPTSDSFAIRQ